jgi:hypothetical protein
MSRQKKGQEARIVHELRRPAQIRILHETLIGQKRCFLFAHITQTPTFSASWLPRHNTQEGFARGPCL